MIPRGVVDIEWAGVLRAGFGCLDPRSGRSRDWDGPGIAAGRCGVLSLSVRTAFDALLTAMKWAPGSEILMSAITIADMLRIINEHGLVAVPLDVPCGTLAPTAEQVARQITSRTRAVMVAHLFGAKAGLEAIGDVCRRNHLPLWEDVAQGYPADLTLADPAADVSFFSFGKIKTCTAAGGALIVFRDPLLAIATQEVEAAFPQQSRQSYARALADLAILKLMGSRFAFAATGVACRALGSDLDELLNVSSQGFSGKNFFAQIRRRPSDSLTRFLRQRLTSERGTKLLWKQELADEYRRTLRVDCLVGADAAFPTRWVYPIRCHSPSQLVKALRAAAYDATSRASRLVVAPAHGHDPGARPIEAAAWLPNTVYLPLHPLLNRNGQHEIANVVNRHCEQQQDGRGKDRSVQLDR